MKFLTKKLFRLRNAINARVKAHGAQYTAFGIFGLITYPGFYFLSEYYAWVHATNLTLRIIATILCLPLALNHYWPKKWRIWLPSYWYLTLTYCLPFFLTVVMLENISASIVWVITLPVVLMWLVILLDSFSFIISLAIGAILAIIFYIFTMTNQVFNDYLYIVCIQCIVLFSLTYYFLYHREKFKELQDKTHAIKPVAAGIAHELRTPLASINAGATGVKQFLPILLDAYVLAKENNLPIEQLRDLHIKQLRNTLDNVSRETYYANTIIDMLLMQVNHSAINPNTFQINSIKDVITEALDRYPFVANCRDKYVEFDNKHSFLFYGDKLLFIHVIFNLIKNALYYIAEAEKGKIYIRLSERKQYHCLHFKDTGKGIDESSIANIFDTFYSTNPNGSGIGLAFCRTVMKSMQGDIQCHSKLGEFTEFVLRFPKVKTSN